MCLQEILKKIVESNETVVLSDRKKDWNANELLENLSGPMLKRQAHFQPGMYIALINDGGYLGEVIYRVKQNG